MVVVYLNGYLFYTLFMHSIQQAIVNLSREEDISGFTLREIGEKIDVKHPQKVKHHLDQLIKKGILRKTKEGILPTVQNSSTDLFISLPVYGSANCGEARLVAEENLEGFLQVSKSLLNGLDPENLFTVKASGNSLNKADFYSKNIETGDYLIIDCKTRTDYDGKYVLSVINGMANIKKFKLDKQNKCIVLFSESTENYHPIYIHQEDFDNYLINGVVVDVIKNPKNLENFAAA